VTDKNELYLVDGSGFIFRAYYAMAYGGQGKLTNPDGVPIGAVMGFTNMILKLLRDYHAPYIAVIFDAGRVTFRNDIYPEYKANRDETPEDLIPQFPLVRDATEAFDIPCIELEGYEADDLIATYARQAKEAGKKVVIVSSDKDLMQLVDEELLARAEEIKQPKRREKLIENAELARISKQLVTLAQDAPTPVALDDLKVRDGDHPNLVPFLEKHGFTSIIKRLGGTPSSAPKTAYSSGESQEDGAPASAWTQPELPPIKDNVYTLINDEPTLQSWIDAAYKKGLLVIDTETTSLTPAKAELVGISIASTAGKAAYIPLGHKAQQADLLGDISNDGSDIPQMDKAKALAMLKPILEDQAIMKVAQNMKYDWQLFARENIHVAPCDDTMLMSYVLDDSSAKHSMDAMSERYLNHAPIKYADVAGKGAKQVTFDYVDIERALDYAAEDADITLRLYTILKPRIAQEKMARVYENIERPLIPVIAQMELEGIKVDPTILKSMSTEFGIAIADLEADIWRIAGTEFNIGSPKQIGEILFDQMGLEGGKKTKTGQWSTDVKSLEKLAADGHEIVEKILEWRGLSKLKSTYTDALQEQINPATGRVHTSYSMAGTSTGRLASSDPNLQNIPIRTEEGRKIRTAFVANDGHTLLSVDYSQVELRLSAEMAGVAALKSAFKDGVDIHSLTASQVFDVPLDEVTPEIRRQAKAVNFGIIYGISGWGLAKQLGCDKSCKAPIRALTPRISMCR